jgi:hypothetical protein
VKSAGIAKLGKITGTHFCTLFRALSLLNK